MPRVISTGDLRMSKENITALELSAMNDEKVRDAKREANRRFRERRDARMSEDPEYAALIKERRREYRRRYEEKLTAEQANGKGEWIPLFAAGLGHAVWGTSYLFSRVALQYFSEITPLGVF